MNPDAVPRPDSYDFEQQGMTRQQFKERRIWWQAYRAALAGGRTNPDQWANCAVGDYFLKEQQLKEKHA